MDQDNKYCDKSSAGNKYYLIRHGEAESNIRRTATYKLGDKDVLTGAGIKQAYDLAEKISKQDINLAFCSPFLRAKQTLDIVKERVGLSEEDISFDKRIEEVNFGIYDNKPYEAYHENFPDKKSYFHKEVEEGENYQDVWSRLKDFLADLEDRYQNKNILVVSHGFPLRMLQIEAAGADISGAIAALDEKYIVDRGQLEVLEFPCGS